MAGVEGFEPPTLGLENQKSVLILNRINSLEMTNGNKSGQIRNPRATGFSWLVS